MSRPRRLVAVTGTSTDVGKTWVSAQLLSAARQQGLSVAARKPVQSFDPDEGRPTDAEELARASGEDPQVVCPAHRSYPLAVAPPMAVDRLAGHTAPLLLSQLLSEIRWGEQGVDVGLVETVGGVRSPVTHDADSARLVSALRPDVVLLVADAGLGTINSVRLSLAALAVELSGDEPGAPPIQVVLNRFDPGDALHVDNARWLHRHDEIDAVATGHDGWIGRLLALVRPIG